MSIPFVDHNGDERKFTEEYMKTLGLDPLNRYSDDVLEAIEKMYLEANS